MIYHGSQDLSDWPAHVAQTVSKLSRWKRRYDSIVVQGMSGLLVGCPAALRLSVPLVVVRKESDYRDCHGGSRIINIYSIGKRFLFLDDFVSLGDTFTRCIEEIDYHTVRAGLPVPRCTAVYQYRYNSLTFKTGGYSVADVI